MIQKFGFSFILALALSACHSTKSDVQTNNLNAADQYLVFGKYFGHCAAECATLYKMEGNQLFADDLPRFMGWEELKFKSEPLANARLKAAKDLLASFPPELMKEDETIGCPDCADQGGFALAIRKDGKIYHWNIDTNRDQLPDYLKSYVEQMNAVIEKLK